MQPVSSSAQLADDVILAVADEQRTVAVDKDSMRPGQATFQRRTIGAVALLAVADDQFQGAAAGVDHANRVRLGVGQIHVACSIERDALRTRERRLESRAAIASEARLACA